MAHLASAMVVQENNRLIFSQVAVKGKSNEITAIPELLELLNMQEALVTIDAIGNQEEAIAEMFLHHQPAQDDGGGLGGVYSRPLGGGESSALAFGCDIQRGPTTDTGRVWGGELFTHQPNRTESDQT